MMEMITIILTMMSIMMIMVRVIMTTMIITIHPVCVDSEDPMSD